MIGHRGAAASAPENTLAGFRRAQALGCRWVEFDVRLTSDRGLVLVHDSRLDRTTDGHGRVAAAPLAVVRQYDAGKWFDASFAGEPVPTLDEALDLCLELGLGGNIEIKAEHGDGRTTASAVGAVLARRTMANRPPLLISSFLPTALAAARALIPDFPRGLLLRRVPRCWQILASLTGAAAIHVDQRRLNPALAGAIRAAGYPLLAYTVNEPELARRLFTWGVTSVFSDAPDIILAATATSGEPCAVAARQGAMR